MIVEGFAHEAPVERRVHTQVVGSGAGGAVVARVLAEAGLDVLVLEEGGYFRAHDFTQREDEMFPALFRSSGQQLTRDASINVLQGSCFGGSTVINMADCTPIPGEVLAHWRSHHGLTLDERELEPSLARVRENLEVNPIRPEQVNANNRAVLDGARALGLEAGTFEHNRVGCLGSGYCLIGCAYDAKKGAHLAYLPQASAAGAEIQTDVRVERLEALPDGRLRAHAWVVERGPRTRRVGYTVTAERIVLAAGSVHTPAILKSSGFDRGLPQLGWNVSLQPQMGVVALFDSERDMRVWRGIPQSAYCSQHDDNAEAHGLGGFRLEAVHGGLSIMAGNIPGFGVAHESVMARFGQLGSSLLLVPDRPTGRMRWKLGESRGFSADIDYQVTPEWTARLRRGLRNAAEIYFAAGAREVMIASELCPTLRGPDDLPVLDEFPIRSAVTHFVSAHVQGTCRMGPDARRSVVDESHRLHTMPNVYVVDGSVMPTTAATHTMIPIMTLADRAAHRMLDAA